MTDLDKLIEAVESGVELDVLDEWGYWLNAFPLTENEKSCGDFESDNAANGRMAWSGSLDAAKLLHEALLPGWRWTRHHDGEIEVWATGVLSRRWGRSDDKDPARAWLLAILKAYRSLQ